MTGATAPNCPLCGHARCKPLCMAWGDAFFVCGECRLIVRDPDSWPAPEEERARYAQHRNDPNDPAYRAFLSKLADPLARLLIESGREPEQCGPGLDFGCGPGPTLSRMLEERGFRVTDYDPFFFAGDEALRSTYGFISCSEVLEHLHAPRRTLDLLDRMLRPAGLLGVMTGIVDDSRDFATWAYARDPTHVCFFHERTMRWIARSRGWALTRPSPTVAIFRKPTSSEE